MLLAGSCVSILGSIWLQAHFCILNGHFRSVLSDIIGFA